MTDLAIRARGLSKRYRLGRSRRTSLRESLTERLAGPFRALGWVRQPVPGIRPGRARVDDDWVWALSDIDLEVRRGAVLGIIGRNGAGKSTLLKILSRITEPTRGEAEVRGRLGSLLEVGTGFHPELTGRENIYLHGAILGMKRAEIARWFDEIVAFSGVGRFLETPIKHYSSGMSVRLAFAVAAHFEPDVLIVDEVLAVGDSEFQRKCLGKLDSVTSEGRTVLFVSHNMSALQRLCPRSVFLDAGRIVAEGDTGELVNRYLATTTAEAEPETWLDLSAARRTGSGECRFLALQYGSLNDVTRGLPYPRGGLEIRLSLHSEVSRRSVCMAVFISDQHGTKLINADIDTLGVALDLPRGRSTWLFNLEAVYLEPGMYTVGLWLADRSGEVLDRIDAAVRLEVVDHAAKIAGVRIDPRYAGVVTCDFGFRRLDTSERES
jgi:homopolymeric O-antigen transport system ATP-binding protein